MNTNVHYYVIKSTLHSWSLFPVMIRDIFSTGLVSKTPGKPSRINFLREAGMAIVTATESSNAVHNRAGAKRRAWGIIWQGD
jgi:hypothetical protein